MTRLPTGKAGSLLFIGQKGVLDFFFFFAEFNCSFAPFVFHSRDKAKRKFNNYCSESTENLLHRPAAISLTLAVRAATIKLQQRLEKKSAFAMNEEAIPAACLLAYLAG